MALISIAGQVDTQSAATASSFASGSFTQSANKLNIAIVTSSFATTPNTPTISGWTQIASVAFATIALPKTRITLFYILPGSDSTGTITADFAGQLQLGCGIMVHEFTNAAIAGMIVQSATGSSDAVANNGFLAVAPASTYGDTANATFAAFADNPNSSLTAGPNFTTNQYYDGYASAQPANTMTEFSAYNMTQEAKPNCQNTSGGNLAMAGIFCEIKNATPNAVGGGARLGLIGAGVS